MTGAGVSFVRGLWRRLSPSSPSRRVRLLVVHHRLQGRLGHRFQEALGLRREAVRRGWSYSLWVHRDAEPDVVEATGGAPELWDPVFASGRAFADRAEDLRAQLDRHVTPALRRDDRVLMTVATQCEGLAFLRWLADQPRERKPWVVLLFLSDRWNREGADRAAQLAELAALRGELAAASAGDRRRWVPFATTPGLVQEISRLLGVELALSPIALGYGGFPALATSVRASETVPERLRVLLAGGARPEKGGEVLPEALRLAAASGRFEFLLQLANEQLAGPALADLRAAATAAKAEVVEGGLDEAGYASLFARSHLVLLPYQRLPYRQRPSGVLCEAAAAALPAIVPTGTWLAEQIESGAMSGVVFNEPTPASIVRGMEEAAERYIELRGLAEARASASRAHHSISGFLDAVEIEIARRAGGS